MLELRKWCTTSQECPVRLDNGHKSESSQNETLLNFLYSMMQEHVRQHTHNATILVHLLRYCNLIVKCKLRCFLTNKLEDKWTSKDLQCNIWMNLSTSAHILRYKTYHKNPLCVFIRNPTVTWHTSFIPPPSTPTHLPWTAHHLMPPFPIGPASSS